MLRLTRSAGVYTVACVEVPLPFDAHQLTPVGPVVQGKLLLNSHLEGVEFTGLNRFGPTRWLCR